MNSISGIKNFFPLASGDCTNEQWIIYTLSSHSLNSSILHLQGFKLVNVNATLLLRSFHCCLFTVPSSRAVTNIWNVGQWVFRLELYLTSRFNSEEWRDKDNRVITQLRATFGECTMLLYECMYMQYILHNRKMTLGIPFHAVSAL